MACYLISGKTLGQIKASGASIPANSSWNSLLMSRWGLVQTLFLSFGKIWWMGRSEVLSKGSAHDHSVETMVSEAEGENWSKSGKVLLHDKSSPIRTLMSLPTIIIMLFKARDALWFLGLFNWFVFVGNKLWTCIDKYLTCHPYKFLCTLMSVSFSNNK